MASSKLLGTGLFFALGAVVNLLGYVFVLLTVRSFSAEEFGVLGALLAVITVSSTWANAVQLRTTRAAAVEAIALPDLFRRELRRVVPVGAGALLATAVVAAPSAPLLHTTPSAVLVTGLVIVLFMFAGVANGVLLGRHRFLAQGTVQLAGSLARVVLVAVVVQAGLGVPFAVLCYGAHFIVVLVAAWALADGGTAPTTIAAPADEPPMSRLLVLATFLVTLALMLDQLLVQLLHPALGGPYAALQTLAKVAFYACGPLLTLVYPHLVRARADRARTARTFGMSLAGVLGIAGALVLVYATLGDWIVRAALSEKYAALAPLLPWATGALGMYCVAYLLFLFLLARDQRAALWPVAIAVLAQTALFATCDERIEALVQSLVASCAVLLAGLSIVAAWSAFTPARRAASTSG